MAPPPTRLVLVRPSLRRIVGTRVPPKREAVLGAGQRSWMQPRLRWSWPRAAWPPTLRPSALRRTAHQVPPKWDTSSQWAPPQPPRAAASLRATRAQPRSGPRIREMRSTGARAAAWAASPIGRGLLPRLGPWWTGQRPLEQLRAAMQVRHQHLATGRPRLRRWRAVLLLGGPVLRRRLGENCWRWTCWQGRRRLAPTARRPSHQGGESRAGHERLCVGRQEGAPGFAGRSVGVGSSLGAARA